MRLPSLFSLIGLSLVGCATAKVTTSVTNPAYQGQQYEMVVALFLSTDLAIRQSAESAFVSSDSMTFRPAFHYVPSLDTEVDDLARRLEAALPDAYLIVSPSEETIGGGSRNVTSEVCVAVNPDGSCMRSLSITRGVEVNVLWAGFSAALYDAATGEVAWTASIESRPETGSGRPSPAELARTASEQLYRRLVEDGLVRRGGGG